MSPMSLPPWYTAPLTRPPSHSVRGRSLSLASAAVTSFEARPVSGKAVKVGASGYLGASCVEQ